MYILASHYHVILVVWYFAVSYVYISISSSSSYHVISVFWCFAVCYVYISISLSSDITSSQPSDTLLCVMYILASHYHLISHHLSLLILCCVLPSHNCQIIVSWFQYSDTLLCVTSLPRANGQKIQRRISSDLWTVCHQHYGHRTCRKAPSSGHWRRTCSRPPGAIETFSWFWI